VKFGDGPAAVIGDESRIMPLFGIQDKACENRTFCTSLGMGRRG
jgi:hypothetical protein